jgi:GntR family carbon starvation induced transcriptional regulator
LAASKSLAEEAYAVLRRAIMDGDPPPLARLGPAELSARLGLGTTPIREALSRLAAEHMVVALPQRGFRVAPLTAAELSDLLNLRLGFEREAVIVSMQARHPRWRLGVEDALAALLRTTPPAPGQRSGELADWNRAHDRFHEALMAGADLPWLQRFHRRTLDQIERYRAAMLRRHAASDAPQADPRFTRLLGHAEHAEIAEAVLRGDHMRVDTMLDRHMREAGAVFMALFAEAPGASGKGLAA